MPGTDLITKERVRQWSEEGWDSHHDDHHGNDQLALAAVCYALPMDRRIGWQHNRGNIPEIWPWDDQWWKPTPDDRIRELVKAGALIAAEIDRLQRLAALPRKQASKTRGQVKMTYKNRPLTELEHDALQLLKKLCFDRGVIIHASTVDDPRDVFIEFCHRHGLSIDNFNFDDSRIKDG